jgi:hypothetical protein
MAVRYERLVIEAGDNSFCLDLHPRLTVIAGVGRVERDALVGELVGALSSNRSGVHLEAVEDGGRRLAVFRPTGAAARVVDVDRACDVTNEFRAADGRVNLLDRAGLDATSARRKLRFGAPDLQAATHGAQLVGQLAAADQPELWAAAEAVLNAETALQTEAEAVGSAPEDAEIIERIEEHHRRFEDAQARHERLRRITLAVGGLSTIAAGAAAMSGIEAAAAALLLFATVTMLVSVHTRTRAERARGAEADALAAAGAQSYLGFHLQRVNGMLSSDQARKRLIAVGETHRRATADWKALAGDVPVEWAIDHYEEINAAARVRLDISSHASMAVAEHVNDDDTTTDHLARVLIGRLAELRRLGGGTEGLPLILDDPFAELDRSAKPALLELLSHTSGSPQLIYLTDDEDVASWARLEALTGALAIIEPDAESPEVDRARRRLTRST